jgi:thymidine kinase
MAKLYFWYGAMSSGKSAYLLQVAHNYEKSGKQTLIAKPSVDTKSGQMVSSRIGISRNIDFVISPDMDVFAALSDYNKEHLIEHGEPVAALVIDEAQFMSKAQVNQLLKIATLLDVPVLCFGIRSDFATNGFSGSDRLLQIAHSIEEMKTICENCGKGKATLNARKVNGEYAFTGNQVLIDVGSDSTKEVESEVSYESLCSGCYLKFSKGQLGS